MSRDGDVDAVDLTAALEQEDEPRDAGVLEIPHLRENEGEVEPDGSFRDRRAVRGGHAGALIYLFGVCRRQAKRVERHDQRCPEIAEENRDGEGDLARDRAHREDQLEPDRERDVEPDGPASPAGESNGVGDLAEVIGHQGHIRGLDRGGRTASKRDGD